MLSLAAILPRLPLAVIAALCAALLALWGYAGRLQSELTNARAARDAALASASAWERLYNADTSTGNPAADAEWLSQRGRTGPAVQSD